MDTIQFRAPDDLHVHLRQGDAMPGYARRVGESFARALIMPNLIPPVTTPDDVAKYDRLIRDAAPGLETLMTFKLMPGMRASQITALKLEGVIAGKYYPEGVTTNAEDGIRGTDDLYPILEYMEEEDLVLCIHGETPEAPVLERETDFLGQLEDMATQFPRLRMVFEHVSSADAVRSVIELPATVSATVTVHHLLFTLEDMMANGLNPHLYCKPVVKSEADRLAIEKVVLEGRSEFFFGSDSAPHPIESKTRSPASAGVYSAPVALPLLIDFFDRNGAIDKLEDFTSRFGAEFYRVPLNEETVEWERTSWKVPDTVDGVIPLCAGQELGWAKKDAAG